VIEHEYRSVVFVIDDWNVIFDSGYARTTYV
jgi:hypothetical protein